MSKVFTPIPQKLLLIFRWLVILQEMSSISKLIQIQLKFCFDFILQRLLMPFAFERSFIVTRRVYDPDINKDGFA